MRRSNRAEVRSIATTARTRAVVLRLQPRQLRGEPAMHQTMIVSCCMPSVRDRTDDVIVVTTPLDAVVHLERQNRIRTVVLAGSFARNHELAAFLGSFYPAVHVERQP